MDQPVLTDEQLAALRKQLAQLPPEKLEELKKQQIGIGGQCPFCLMVQGKIEIKKVYEDDFVLAILDINPATPGHTIVFPKKDYKSISQLSKTEAGHLFYTTIIIALKITKALGAQAFNLFIAEGSVAGQKFENDMLELTWTPHKATEEELVTIQNKILKEMGSAEPKVIEKKDEKEILDYKLEKRLP